MKHSTCCRHRIAASLNCFTEFLSKGLPLISLCIVIWIALLAIFPSIKCCGRFAFVTNPKFMIKCLGAILSLWVIAFNLKKYIDVQTVQLLGDLRKMLNSDEKRRIHFFLMRKEDKKAVIDKLEKDERYKKKEENEDAEIVYSVDSKDDQLKEQHNIDNGTINHSNVELFDYLGTIELGAIMLDLGLITTEQFKNQFGYRLDNIMESPDLLRHLTDEQSSYYYLWKAICLMRCVK